MRWFYNMRIRAKLLAGFTLIALLAAAIGTIGLINIRKINANDQLMYEQMTVPLSQLGGISTAFQRVRVNLAKLIMDDSIRKKEEAQGLISKYSTEITELVGAFEKSVSSEGEKAHLNEFNNTRKEFLPIISRIIELSKSGKQAEAVALFQNEAVTAARAEQAAIERLVADKVQAAKDTSSRNQEVGRKASMLMIAFTVIGILLALGIGFFLAAVISGQLREKVTFAEAIADGDLTRSLEVRSSDEIGQLARALNSMREKLHTVINRMVETTETVSSAAVQLSSASEQMATGTEEVAAQAGTVAVASEEMAATSNEIAQNCHLSADSANRAAETTRNGFEVVQHTVEGIRSRGERTRDNARIVASLGQRSDQIGDIVSTIEDIADQTNLLALNAAIEAARAGEQGRGFAVVADEVRALAERTTRATKEISEMIRSIQSETRTAIASMEEGVRGTERGAAEAAQLETSLQEILDQVSAVTMQISQIATAAEQQTSTTSEITNNIQQITEVVQDTARGAQESAGASNELARSAEELRALAGHFKLAAG
ncbi:methyl-accepting chemotaxis protein [bacterium]|nr:methyl-accepting chemotaxis protein [bacterium]